MARGFEETSSEAKKLGEDLYFPESVRPWIFWCGLALAGIFIASGSGTIAYMYVHRHERDAYEQILSDHEERFEMTESEAEGEAEHSYLGVN